MTARTTSTARIVDEEPRWRHLPASVADAAGRQKVAATRWRSFQTGTLAVRADSSDSCHVVGIALRQINVRLSFCGRVVQDGVFMPGMLVTNEPGLVIDGQLRGPTDVLHLHIPNAIIAECAGHIDPRGPAALPSGARAVRDPAMERLGLALLGADALGSPFSRLYADALSIAIVTRLLETARGTHPSTRPKASPLAGWRLRRALEYVDGNLAGPIRLGDLAAAAGLTRMHFAAQFRAATGLRPHEYLLRRRIERAQDLMRAARCSIKEVAAAVGFQTQAHFSATFRRFVGQPPDAWRRTLEQAA